MRDQLVLRQIISRTAQVLRYSVSVQNFCRFLNFCLQLGSGPEVATALIASNGGILAVPGGLFVWSRPSTEVSGAASPTYCC